MSLPNYTARDLDEAREELEQELTTGPGWMELVDEHMTPSQRDAFFAAVATEYELRMNRDRLFGQAVAHIADKPIRVEAERRAQAAANERVGGLQVWRETQAITAGIFGDAA